jgi:predicted esterase
LQHTASGQTDEEDDRQTLALSFNHAYRDREWSRAIRLGHELAEAAPDNSIYAYNLACVYALSGDTDNAGTWLVAAARRGFTHIRRLTTDPDIADLRGSDAYATVLARVKTNQEEALARAEVKFLEHPPLVELPPGHDPSKAPPLIIALHGYGCRPESMIAQWREVADQIGAIVAAPQGLYKVRGSRGYSWFAPGSVDFDEADHLTRFTLDLLMKKHKIDPSRVILTGFSQGGYVAYAAGSRQPYRFPSVIPMGAGYVPAIDAPDQAAGGNRPRFYFMIGRHDPAVGQLDKAVEDFTKAGFVVKPRIYPAVGHAFPTDMVEEIQDALDFVLDRR